MGAHLVARVLADWTHLPDRPFRILVRMALTALDKPNGDAPACVYFAGRELLAMTLRGEGSEQSRNRAVARTVADLIEAGAIERTDGGRPGHNAVYRLTLGGSASARKPTGKGGSTDHPKPAPKATDLGGPYDHPLGGSYDHPMGDNHATKWVAPTTTPRNHEEPIEELYEETGVEETTTSHRSRVNRPTAETAPVIPLFPKPRRALEALDAIAEARARRAKAVAEHQARLAAEATEVS